MATTAKRQKGVELDIYSALRVYHNEVETILKSLIQPMNSAKTTQSELMTRLDKVITEWYNNVKLSINNGTLLNDPSGILSNETVFSTMKAKAKYAHAKALEQIIENLITADGDNIMANRTSNNRRTKATKAQEPANLLVTEETTEVNYTASVKEETNTDAPVATVEEAKEIVVETPVGDIKMELPVSFHTPYYDKINALLESLNGDNNEDEIKSFKNRIKATVREWVDDFYTSLYDIDNPDRVKDGEGILEGKTKYSSSIYLSQYDYAHLVDMYIEQINEKYKTTKTTNTEVPVHTMATALSAAQDDSQREFTVHTNEAEGEAITVNKDTGDVTVTKDNIVVAYAKKAYTGVINFFKKVWAKLKDFGNWIKERILGTTDKEKQPVVTPEEAKRLAEEAIRSVKASLSNS